MYKDKHDFSSLPFIFATWIAVAFIAMLPFMFSMLENQLLTLQVPDFKKFLKSKDALSIAFTYISIIIVDISKYKDVCEDTILLIVSTLTLILAITISYLLTLPTPTKLSGILKIVMCYVCDSTYHVNIIVFLVLAMITILMFSCVYTKPFNHRKNKKEK